MPVVWLNGTVGSGKSTVGAALASLLPASRFLDGDDVAGPSLPPDRVRWGMALDALLAAVLGRGRLLWLILAYPLDAADLRRLRAACAKAGRLLAVVNLDVPLSLVLRARRQGVEHGREAARPDRALRGLPPPALRDRHLV